MLPLKHRLGEHLASRVTVGTPKAHRIGRFEDLVIAEFPIENTSLANRTIRDTRLHQMKCRCLDIPVGVETQLPIVEIDEALAKAGRAAHVGREDADAPRQQRLVEAAEPRTLLALGTTVEAQHVGRRPFDAEGLPT